MMPHREPIIAIFPGTFDPVTIGHLDVIQRGRHLFDELIVAVGHNPEKKPLFSAAERVDMIEELVRGMDNVRVQSYDTLTLTFARQVGARVILRGIRDSIDLHSELQQANTNRVVGGIETVFLMTSYEHALTSSTLIKQIVQMGGYDPQRLATLVPEGVARRLVAKLAPQGTQGG